MDTQSYDQVIKPHWFWWIAVIGGMALFFAICLHPGVYEYWITHRHPLPDPGTLHLVLVAAVGLHIFEGWYCYHVATKLGLHKSARSWGWQTFVLGYPSTRLLLRLRDTIEAARAEEAQEPEAVESAPETNEDAQGAA